MLLVLFLLSTKTFSHTDHNLNEPIINDSIKISILKIKNL